MQLEQERRACRGLGCKDAESKSQQGQLGGELSRQELSEVSEREDKVNRLTDDKTAAALKENIEKLKAAGIEVDASNERYVRLAELERQTEWISVKDRMPEEDVRVIVYSSIKTIGIAYQINDMWFTKDLLMSSPCNKITHWMPLPEPIKEE